MAAIKVENLRKVFKVHSRASGLGAALRSLVKREYNDVAAVNGISFAIEPGEIVGFLGPNGAGKTTTLKMLAGLLHPSEGQIEVAGFVPSKREVPFLKKVMLVMGQKQQLLWDLPPADTFELNRAIYDIDRAAFKTHLDELIELLAIADVITRPTRQLSLGERMKCELAAALIHKPSVLFLDEPTIGLDVTMQGAVRKFIQTYNERTKATVILTSHYMQDVEALCERVIVIDQGKLAYDGGLDALTTRLRPEKRVVLRLTSMPTPLPELLGTVVAQEDNTLTLSVTQNQIAACVTRALSALSVQDLTIEDPPLEEIMSTFFSHAGHA